MVFELNLYLTHLGRILKLVSNVTYQFLWVVPGGRIIGASSDSKICKQKVKLLKKRFL